MTRHGTLVRFWENGFQNEVAAEWVDWQDGWFHLYADSPLARELDDAARCLSSLLLTVYSTNELIWGVESTRVENPSWTRPYMTVHCVPWVERVRRSLASDDYMVTLWLQAETLHRECAE